jgi:hypothetical protein
LIINDLGFKMEKLQHPVTTNPKSFRFVFGVQVRQKTIPGT